MMVEAVGNAVDVPDGVVDGIVDSDGAFKGIEAGKIGGSRGVRHVVFSNRSHAMTCPNPVAGVLMDR